MKFAKVFPRAVVLSVVILSAGLITSGAKAQDTFSESHLEAAKRVTAVTRVMEPFDNILPLLAEQTKTAFIQSDPPRAEEIIEITQDVAIKLAARRKELNEKVYAAWAENFTEEELIKLAEFYSTDLGQKLTNKIPVVTQMSLNASREWQDSISVDIVTLVQAELTKRNNQ